MHKKLILGSVLVLTLTLTSPVVAAEASPFTWPNIDMVEWVFGLLEVFELESSGLEMGPAAEPNGEPSVSEMGPGFEPNGGKGPTTAEMGPGAEPNGETTEEIGPGYEPWG